MVSSISNRRAPLPTLTVLYDGDCGFCSWCASILARLDRRRRLRLVALAGATLPDQPPLDQLVESIHAVDAEGRWWAGTDAWLEIFRRVPALRPLSSVAQLPLARPLFDLVYRLVARNRRPLSRLLGLTACIRRR